MNKVLVALGVLGLIVTCIFAIREPMSLVFIIGVFALIAYAFLRVSEKAGLNRRLSKAEQKGTLLFCAIGFLVVSAISNIGFLVWVNSMTPIWGDGYSTRLEHEASHNAAKAETQRLENEDAIRRYNAEESVKSNLKDPSSAKFSEATAGKHGSVCGTVNAKNSFGAYSGDSRYVSSGGKTSIDDGGQEFSSLWNSKCN